MNSNFIYTKDLTDKFNYEDLKYFQIVCKSKLKSFENECNSNLNIRNSFDLSINENFQDTKFKSNYWLKITADNYYHEEYLKLLNELLKNKQYYNVNLKDQHKLVYCYGQDLFDSLPDWEKSNKTVLLTPLHLKLFPFKLFPSNQFLNEFLIEFIVFLLRISCTIIFLVFKLILFILKSCLSFLNPKLSIKIMYGSIVDAKADVIVNLTNKRLDLDIGNISRSILEEAGTSIKHELQSKYLWGIDDTEVAITSSGNIKNSNFIYHVILYKTNNDQIRSIRDTIFKILETADLNQVYSIAFPVLGVGYLKPKHIPILMNNFISEYFELNKQSLIKKVLIVVYKYGNSELVRAFKTFEKMEYILSNPIRNVHLISNDMEKIENAKRSLEFEIDSQMIVKCFDCSDLTTDEKEIIEKICKNYLVLFNWEQNKLILTGIENNILDCIDFLSIFKFNLSETNIKNDSECVVYNLPNNWNVCNEPTLVDLLQNENEFLNIVDNLNRNGLQTICKRIISIQRIQNKHLFTQYNSFKNQMQQQYLFNKDIERTVYHGSNEENIESIWRKGFNRSFAGRNANAYGKGVYFAKEITLSHKYTDIPRDIPKGRPRGHIFICKIIIGKFEKGSSSFIVPPNDCDSTVDDVLNPTIYVIYNDAQAYPEYILTYE